MKKENCKQIFINNYLPTSNFCAKNKNKKSNSKSEVEII
jgi:hypothetical protein